MHNSNHTWVQYSLIIFILNWNFRFIDESKKEDFFNWFNNLIYYCYLWEHSHFSQYVPPPNKNTSRVNGEGGDYIAHACNACFGYFKDLKIPPREGSILEPPLYTVCPRSPDQFYKITFWMNGQDYIQYLFINTASCTFQLHECFVLFLINLGNLKTHGTVIKR